MNHNLFPPLEMYDFQLMESLKSVPKAPKSLEIFLKGGGGGWFISLVFLWLSLTSSYEQNHTVQTFTVNTQNVFKIATGKF